MVGDFDRPSQIFDRHVGFSAKVGCRMRLDLCLTGEVIVFAAASILKDTVNRIGDLLDDGKPNASFTG
jgi:hypothetical protein